MCRVRNVLGEVVETGGMACVCCLACPASLLHLIKTKRWFLCGMNGFGINISVIEKVMSFMHLIIGAIKHPRTVCFLLPFYPAFAIILLCERLVFCGFV